MSAPSPEFLDLPPFSRYKEVLEEVQGAQNREDVARIGARVLLLESSYPLLGVAYRVWRDAWRRLRGTRRVEVTAQDLVSATFTLVGAAGSLATLLVLLEHHHARDLVVPPGPGGGVPVLRGDPPGTGGSVPVGDLPPVSAHLPNPPDAGPGGTLSVSPGDPAASSS
jgi:hypothetical protein